MSIETEVAQTLGNINEVLKEVAKEKIDPSVYTQILQDFTEEKKGELQELVNKVDDPLGEKTITMETIGKQRAFYGAYVYQEVWKKDGKITRYGDFILMGYCDDNMLAVNATGGGKLRIPLPNDVEFERLIVSYHNFYAIPKAGQNDVGGISGSLDNYLFCLGYNAYGQLGKGDVSDAVVPYVHQFEARVKKLLVSGHGSDIYTGCFALLENGKVFVCGAQPEGYFGIGNTSQVNAWTQAHSEVDDIFVSPFDCWIIKKGVIYAMGWNGVGQLGCNSSGQKNSPVQIKSGVSNAFIQCFAEYQGNTWYCTTFMMLDGELWAAGRNSHHQFSSNNTSDTNVLVRVTDGGGIPLQTPKGTCFLNHPLLTIILIPNDGNTDLYVSGYGEYGFGDGTRDTTTKLKKIRTLEGLGWTLDSNFGSDNYQDAIDCIFVINKQKQEIWAWGYNSYGELGLGWRGEEPTLKRVILPTKGLKQFEAWACFDAGNNGSLCVIVDGVLYVCGNNTHQRISRVTPILSPVARA